MAFGLVFMRFGLVVVLFAKLYGDEAGDAGFAHGDADELVAGLHGAFAVGDDDELGLSRHFAQKRAQAADVGVIEWRVHFVQKAEWRRVQAEEREDEGERSQALFRRRRARSGF